MRSVPSERTGRAGEMSPLAPCPSYRWERLGCLVRAEYDVVVALVWYSSLDAALHARKVERA